jgi:hypothetical protein
LQSLIDPSSLFFDDAAGLNVVMLRFEDLGRRGYELSPPERVEPLVIRTRACA